MAQVYAVRASAFVVYDGTNASEIEAFMGSELTGFTVINSTEQNGTLSIEWEIDSASYSTGTAVFGSGDAIGPNTTQVVPAAEWSTQYVKV